MDPYIREIIKTDIRLPPRGPDGMPDYSAIVSKSTRMKGRWNGYIPQRWTKGIRWFPDFERDRWNFEYMRLKTRSEKEAEMSHNALEAMLDDAGIEMQRC